MIRAEEMGWASKDVERSEVTVTMQSQCGKNKIRKKLRPAKGNSEFLIMEKELSVVDLTWLTELMSFCSAQVGSSSPLHGVVMGAAGLHQSNSPNTSLSGIAPPLVTIIGELAAVGMLYGFKYTGFLLRPWKKDKGHSSSLASN